MSLAADFGVTLTQHVLTRQHLHPEARGQFSGLLTQIGVAGKLIAAQVRRAGLIEIWGNTGETNVQGESVKKLDRIANDTLKEVLRRSGCVAVMASEEEPDAVVVEPELAGDYVVAFDPLDGSSNIEASVSIGTIFAIYPRLKDTPPGPAHLLRPGRAQVAAGYIIYGSSTVLVYTDGNTVDCFTLDPSCGEFFLTREAMRYRSETRILSLNECNEATWPRWVAPYIGAIKGRNTPTNRRVTDRHIGSLVADFHRNLVKGGLFLYPTDRTTGRGKLRLLYECNPLAFIAEVAGGAASWGAGPILDLTPTSLHQRTGLIIGGQDDVGLAERFAAEYTD